MKNILKRLKFAIVAFFVALTSVPFGAFFNQAHAATQDVVNPAGPNTAAGDVKLYKTATAVPNTTNQWEIKLRVEAPKTLLKSDTVIVVDRSGSMSTNSRMQNAKTAANSLAKQLLDANDPVNPTNRVAIVSFSDVADSNVAWDTDIAKIQAKVNAMNANGGTFTQDAMHVAANLLTASDANIKNIVLLSDGEPSYSFRINNPDDYLVDGGPGTWLSGLGGWFGANEEETSVNVPQSAYIYTGNNRRVGEGGEQGIGVWNPAEIMWWRYNWNVFAPDYYNHGNSAIAEAGFCKSNAKCGNIYTVALDLDTTSVGNKVLNQMASPGKNYTATSQNLNTIFNDIAGEIKNAINSASIVDTMGDAIVVSGTNSKTININSLTFKEDKSLYGGKGGYYWEDTYTVEANSDQSNTQDINGNFLLNKEAKLTYTYNGKTETGTFPIPAVSAPMAIKVKKTVTHPSFSTNPDPNAEFKVTVSGPTGFTAEDVWLKAGETKNIVKAFPTGDYTVKETDARNNKIALKNYRDTYKVDNTTTSSFTITQNQGDDVSVEVNNDYTTASVTAEQKWDDAGDQDGLRKNYNFFLVLRHPNTKEIVDSIAVSKTNNSTSRSDWLSPLGIPAYENGNALTFETDVMKDCSKNSSGTFTCTAFNGDANYTKNTSTNGRTITLSHPPEVLNVAVNKTWFDGGNRDKIRLPSEVNFCIEGKGKNSVVVVSMCTDDTLIPSPYTATKTIFQAQDDKILAEFGNLPKYQPGEQGVLVQYTVSEKMGKLQDYTTSIPNGHIITTSNSVDVTNTHDPYRRDINAQIDWDDDNNVNRPAYVEVTLEVGGKAVSPAIKVDKNGPDSSQISLGVIESCGPWCVTFKNQYVNENGQEIQYQVSQSTPKSYDTFVTGDMAKGLTITNALQYNMEAAINWDDNNNQYNSRPTSMRIILEGDDGNSYSATVDQNGARATRAVTMGKCSTQQAWCVAFNNIPRARVLNGTVIPITYKLRQDPALIPNYITSIAGDVTKGFNINNTYYKPVIPSPFPSPSNKFGALSPDTGFNTKTTEGSKASNNLVVMSTIPMALFIVGMFTLVAAVKHKK